MRMPRIERIVVDGLKQVRRHALPDEEARLLGSDFETEISAQSLAAEADLAPRLLRVHRDERWFEMQEIDGALLSDNWLKSERDCSQLLGVLRRLRSISCDHLPTFSLATRCQQLHQRLSEFDAGRGRRMHSRVQALSQENHLSADTLVHGDLHRQNVVVRIADSRWCLLDWEYAHRGHAWEDLAGVLADHPGQLEELECGRGALAASWGDHDESLPLADLRAAVALRSLMNELWTDLFRYVQRGDTKLE